MRFAFAFFGIVCGLGAGEVLSRISLTHELAGRIFRRGDLLALIGSHGIFACDLQEKIEEKPEVDPGSVQAQLTATAVLRNRVGSSARENLHLFVEEFGDQTKLDAALHEDRLRKAQLRETLALTRAGSNWIEKQLPSAVSDKEIVAYFREHPDEFTQPLRIRARHIFLAAPEGSPPELVEAKQKAFDDVIARLRRGQDFSQLAAAVSEDEATKNRGGDLGFFAAERMPAEFFATQENLSPNGEISLVRSHLGFHAVQVIDVRSARAMTFEEVRDEIGNRLLASKRSTEVAALMQQLALAQR